MAVILGIDPGSRITGFGVISSEGSSLRYIASGCVRLSGDDLSDRLRQIFESVNEVIKTHQPTECAVEQVFMSRNASSALKLGHARGAAIVAAVQAEVAVFEYSARQVKQAVVGSGAAQKAQVQHMVQRLLSLSAAPQEDAADALAAALCHAHTNANLLRMAGSSKHRRGRIR